jgi:hypothetical protein
MKRQTLILILLAAVPVFGQREESARRADIRGGGGDGKCTIEVDVDDVAEVEIMGDNARLRTLSGRPSNWRRFVCNRPMPRNPGDFRFQGVDGRGRQTLVRDPRNGGPAVVRIEDPQGGSEGYTFDIMWRGEGGGDGRFNPGLPPDAGPRGRPEYQGDRRDDRSDRGDRRDDRGSWNGEGWNDRWGDRLAFRGRGRGQFFREGNRPTRIYAVDLILDRRDGDATIIFDTERGPNTLTFRGRTRRVEGGTILVDVRVAENASGDESGARGMMNVTIGPERRVINIDMNGDVGGRRFVLRWDY